MDLEHCQHQCVLLTDQHSRAVHGECVHAGTPPAGGWLTSPLLSEHIAASILEPHYSRFAPMPIHLTATHQKST